MKRAKIFIIPTLIFFLALIPRLLNLGSGPQHADEYFDRTGGLIQVESLLRGDFLNPSYWQDPLKTGHPPFGRYFSGAMSVLAKADHSSPKGIFYSRIPAVIFAAISSVLLYLFGLKIFNGDKWVSFAAAIFLAFDSIFMIMTRTAEHYSTAVLLIIAAVFSFYLAVDTKKKKYFFASAIFIGLGMVTNFMTGLLLIAFLFWFFLENKKLAPLIKKEFWKFILFIVPLGVSLSFAIVWPQFIFSLTRMKRMAVMVAYTHQGFDVEKTVNPFTIFSVDQPRGPKGKLWVEKVSLYSYPGEKLLAEFLPEEMEKSAKIKLVEDSEINNKQVLYIKPVSAESQKILGFFPSLIQGDYRIRFNLKTDDNKLNLRVANIEVIAKNDLEEIAILTQKEIMGMDFPETNKYQIFTLPITISEPKVLGFKIDFIGEGKIATNLVPKVHWWRVGDPKYLLFLFFRTPLPELIFFVLGLVFIVYKIFLEKKWELYQSLLFCWLLATVLTIQFILYGKRVQYYTIVPPTIALISGLGLKEFTIKAKHKKIIIALAVLIQIVSVLAFYPLYNYRLVNVGPFGGGIPDFLGGIP